KVGSDVRPLSDERRREILAKVDELAAQALRTLAVAYRPLGDTVPAEPGEELEQELIFAGVVGIIDPPRPEVRDSIAEAHDAGIRVVMITGDHPATAARIAEELGIIAAGERTLTGADLDRLDPSQAAATARDVSVYARVAPEHKLD